MLVIALGFCGWAFLDLITAWRRWGTSTQGPLHTGLALMAVGALAGCGWVLLRLTGQVAVLAHQQQMRQLTVVPGVVLAALTASATVTGVVWPGVHERATGVRRWIRAYRATSRLYPMWRDLIGARPAVALEPATGALRDRLQVRDVSWRLYRRIIEIRDARLALRPYLPASRARARRRLKAATNPSSSHAAAVEGYALADAVQAAAYPDAAAPASAGTVIPGATVLGPVSIEEEAAYLSQVADHYRAATTAAPSGQSAIHDVDDEGPA